MKTVGIHAHYRINNGSDPAVSLFLKRKDICLKFCSPYAKVKATKLQNEHKYFNINPGDQAKLNSFGK